MEKNAIILAAGLGSRLRPLTDTEHKCLTRVCGKPIILNALENLQDAGFGKVTIVAGYLSKQLQKRIGEFGLHLDIQFAENERYAETNTSYSLRCGIDKTDISLCDEIYVIEGDVFFGKEVLDRLINSPKDNATILEPYNRNLEGTFVELGDNGYVRDWRHKSDQEEGYRLEDKYKTVNLHKFSRKFTEEVLIPSLNDVLTDDGMKKPIEKVMREIVRKNPGSIKGEVLHGEKWYEIDDINDLKLAENIFGGGQ